MGQHGKLPATVVEHVADGEYRKGERTTHLVVNAFLQGFRAVDTGESICGMDDTPQGLDVLVPTACQPKHYRCTLNSFVEARSIGIDAHLSQGRPRRRSPRCLAEKARHKT